MFSRPRNRKRTARDGRRRISYKELSSDDSSEDDYEEPSPPRPKRQKTTAAVRPPPKAPVRPKRQKALGAPKKGRSSAGHAPKRFLQPQQPKLESDGIVPDWASLPYEVLLSIFRFASYPRRDEFLYPTGSVKFLLGAARTCKSFTEPALAALYESPPLGFLDWAHGFFDKLTSDRPGQLLNYKVKVKEVVMDVRHTLTHSYQGHGPLSLPGLIAHLPQLNSLRLFTGEDRPPFRPAGRPVRWAFPEAMFEALKEAGCLLKDFRWNGALMAGLQFRMNQIHESPPFQTLRHLAISHMELVSEFTCNPRAPKAEFQVDAVVPLQQLESLSLESCLCADWTIFQTLPKSLTKLTVVNCSSLTSDVLQAYLQQSGRPLKELVLDHNQSLDLKFLPGLGESCPNLEILKMDLTYYSSLMLTHGDASPTYEVLLAPEEVPTWPTALQSIELLHLRNLSLEGAATFFGSIVDAAPHLPHLRELIIKAILNISWRDRAGFREKWISKLRKVFLRNSAPPDPRLASARAYRKWKESQSTAEPASAQHDANSPSKRRSVRIQDAQSQPQDDSSSSEADEELNGSQDGAEPAKKLPRQRMCEVVEISIDNLRPSELRFNEDDFLDTEASGDEEWTGNDRVEYEDVYAYRR